MTKYLRASSVVAILLSLFVFGIYSGGVAQALTTTIDLFNSTSVLGVSLVSGTSPALQSQVVVVDMNATTTHMEYHLPGVTGRNGAALTIKKVGGYGYSLSLYPASGERLDVLDTDMGIGVSDRYSAAITVVADETAGRWWIVNWAPDIAIL